MLRESIARTLSVMCFNSMLITASCILIRRLECDTADPEICKKELSEIFEENFQDCVLEYISQVTRACESFFDDEMTDLLTTGDIYTGMFYRQPFIDCNNFTRRHKNAKENDLLMAVFRDAVRYRVPIKISLPQDIVVRIKGANEDLETAYRDFFQNVHDFWVVLYQAVRDEDLKRYPEYKRLDTYVRMMLAENIPRKYEILNEVIRFLGFRNWFSFYEN